MDAETLNNHEKMREISMKYRKRHKERPSTGAWTTGGTPLMTPSGFETPSSPNRSGEGQSGRPDKVSRNQSSTLRGLKIHMCYQYGFSSQNDLSRYIGSKPFIDGIQ